MNETKVPTDLGVHPIVPPYEFAVDDFTLRMVMAGEIDEAYQMHEDNRAFWASQMDYAADYTFEDMRQAWERASQAFAEGRLISYWIIKNDEKLGDIGMTFTDDGRAILGYKLTESAQHQGFIIRSANRLLEYAFQERGVKSVELHIKPANKDSRQVAERLGAKIVGQTEKEWKGRKSTYDIWEVTPDGQR